MNGYILKIKALLVTTPKIKVFKKSYHLVNNVLYQQEEVCIQKNVFTKNIMLFVWEKSYTKGRCSNTKKKFQICDTKKFQKYRQPKTCVD